MPRRVMGLMGYVGEAVVSSWLKSRHPGTEVLPQIRPLKVSAKGGPYLDFAVLRKRVVESVFEVKSQDYIWDKSSQLNPSLKFIWEHRDEAIEFVLQGGRAVSGTPQSQAYLVLLAPPNEGGMKAIGRSNLQNVLLFDELWRAPAAQAISADRIIDEMRRDVLEALQIVRAPTQGGTLRQRFFEKRGNVPPIVRH